MVLSYMSSQSQGSELHIYSYQQQCYPPYTPQCETVNQIHMTQNTKNAELVNGRFFSFNVMMEYNADECSSTVKIKVQIDIFTKSIAVI